MQRGLLRLVAAAMVVGGLSLTAGSAAAQVQVEGKGPAVSFELTGRVHAQYNTSSVDSVPSSTFLIRRARIVAEVKVNDFVFGKVEPEYGAGSVKVKDAYVRLTFSPSFRWTMGQFKRPFDVFQLRTSTQILMIERPGNIRGVRSCAAFGLAQCSFSAFTAGLEYSERDIGFMVDGWLGSSPFRYYVAMMNGRGDNHAVDENGTKSYTGRVEYDIAGLKVGAHVGVHDYVNDSTATDEYAMAFGGDVDWGVYEAFGPHVKAGVVYGDNWRNLTTPEPSKFFSTQVAATYRFPVSAGERLYAVAPMARVSYGNPDLDASGEEGLLTTAGITFFFVGRNKFAVNVDVWNPSTGNTDYSVKAQTYLYF